MNYQIMPDLSAEEFDELKKDIKARGVQIAVEYDEANNVLDGHHRIRAVEELRAAGHAVAEWPRMIRRGLSESEKRAHARALNLARRHLTQDQRRGLIREQLKDTPEQSDRQIARALGVDNATVSRHRKDLEESGEVLQCNTVIGADGVTQPRAKQSRQPATKPRSVYVSPEVVEKAKTLPSAQRNQVLSGAEPVVNHRAMGTGENEWYTPERYLAMARAVLGEIDLDPASSELANERVKATEFFSENGQGRPWHGRVWMNPPYAQPAIAEFAEKMASAWDSGEIDSAIALTHNYTDTAWFHRLASTCSAVCFTRGRIAFEDPDGRKAAPTQGQAFFYFGKDNERFISVFNEIGIVLCRA